MDILQILHNYYSLKFDQIHFVYVDYITTRAGHLIGSVRVNVYFCLTWHIPCEDNPYCVILKVV